MNLHCMDAGVLAGLLGGQTEVISPVHYIMVFWREVQRGGHARSREERWYLAHIPAILASGEATMRYAAFLLILFSAATAQADIVIEETFSYADGLLWGRNGGIGFSDAWNADYAYVFDGVVQIQEVAPAADFTSRPSDAVLWANDGDVIFFGAHISNGALQGFMNIVPDTGGSFDFVPWQFGFSQQEFYLGGASGGGSYVAFQEYVVVSALVRNDAGDDTAMLWINPTSESEPPLLTSTLNFLPAGVTSLANLSLITSSALTIDDIRVGTTLVEVVPEPSSLFLIGALPPLVMLARRRFWRDLAQPVKIEQSA